MPTEARQLGLLRRCLGPIFDTPLSTGVERREAFLKRWRRANDLAQSRPLHLQKRCCSGNISVRCLQCFANALQL